MSDIQSNLVPGSIWARSKQNGDVALSTVLCVTNLGCAERVLERNPQQVVFITAKHEILSMTIEQFVVNRHYQGIDAEMAATIEAVTTESDGEYEEPIDLDAVTADEADFTKLLGEDISIDEDDEDDEDADDSEPEIIESTLALNVGPHPLADLLESAFVSYTEVPSPTGDTHHILEFRLEHLTLREINAAFFLPDENAIQVFTVTSGTETTKIEPEGFVCAMFKATPAGSFGCLYLSSPGNFRTKDDPTYSEAAVYMGEDVASPNPNEVDMGEDVPMRKTPEVVANPNSITISVS
jgi:hypothetical protein